MKGLKVQNGSSLACVPVSPSCGQWLALWLGVARVEWKRSKQELLKRKAASVKSYSKQLYVCFPCWDRVFHARHVHKSKITTNPNVAPTLWMVISSARLACVPGEKMLRAENHLLDAFLVCLETPPPPPPHSRTTQADQHRTKKGPGLDPSRCCCCECCCCSCCFACCGCDAVASAFAHRAAGGTAVVGDGGAGGTYVLAQVLLVLLLVLVLLWCRWWCC